MIFTNVVVRLNVEYYFRYIITMLLPIFKELYIYTRFGMQEKKSRIFAINARKKLSQFTINILPIQMDSLNCSNFQYVKYF